MIIISKLGNIKCISVVVNISCYYQSDMYCIFSVNKQDNVCCDWCICFIKEKQTFFPDVFPCLLELPVYQKFAGVGSYVNFWSEVCCWDSETHQTKFSCTLF